MRKTLITAALLLSSVAALANPDPNLLVGEWRCELSERSEDMNLEMVTTVNYKRDQSADFNMVMDLEIAALGQALKVGMNGDGGWELNGDQLVVTTGDVSIENLGEPSQFADMIIGQFEQQEMAGNVNRSTIIELTSTRLVEQPEEGGPPNECSR